MLSLINETIGLTSSVKTKLISPPPQKNAADTFAYMMPTNNSNVNLPIAHNYSYPPAYPTAHIRRIGELPATEAPYQVAYLPIIYMPMSAV